MINSIYIIGAGSAGSSIASALHNAGLAMAGVTDQAADRAKALGELLSAPWSADLDERINTADITIVSVSDPAIETVAARAAEKQVCGAHQIWLHLSGALSSRVLAPLAPHVKGIGAFHPAHVFPPGKITPLTPGTCFGVDGNAAALDTAARLAKLLRGTAVTISGENRTRYHAAAVMASNAVIALLAEAREALSSVGIEPETAERMLTTLAAGAVENGRQLGLDAALTGPIQRGDDAAVSGHLQALEASPDAAALYKTLGKSILRLARRLDGADSAALDTIATLLK